MQGIGTYRYVFVRRVRAAGIVFIVRGGYGNSGVD